MVYGIAPSLVAAQVGSPIESRNFRSLSLPFLRFSPRPEIESAGQTTFSIGYVGANEARGNPLILGIVSEDQETTRLLGRIRHGLGKGFDLTLEVPLVARGGGVLDPIIEWWHRNIVHISDPARDRAAYGQSYVTIPGHATFGSAAGVGDVSAIVNKSLGPSTIVSFGIKLPTGSAEKLIGSGAADAGIAIQHTFRINSRWQLLAQLGGVIQGSATAIPNSRTFVGQQALSLMYAPNSKDTFVGQWQGEDSSSVTGDALSDATHRIVTIGYHRKLNNRQRLELFLSENGDFAVQLAKVGPDVTVGIQLTTRW